MKTAVARHPWILIPFISILCVLVLSALPLRQVESSSEKPQLSPAALPDLAGQSQAEADAKRSGCVSCHSSTDSASMHVSATLRLGCTDCHGGKADIALPPGAALSSTEYQVTKSKAHVAPRWQQNARSSANPVRAYTR